MLRPNHLPLLSCRYPKTAGDASARGRGHERARGGRRSLIRGDRAVFIFLRAVFNFQISRLNFTDFGLLSKNAPQFFGPNFVVRFLNRNRDCA